MPQKAKEQTDKAKEYICFHCGKSYTIQKGNFPKVRSPLYTNNDGYLPWCKNCVVEQFEKYEKKYGSDEALRRTCMKYDLYFSPLVIRMVQSANSNVTNSKILAYISKSNLAQISGSCYDDTSIEDEQVIAQEAEAEGDDVAKDGKKVSKKSIKIFGSGFDGDAYPYMQSHYDMLISTCGDHPDIAQQTNAKQLAIIDYQITKSAQSDAKSVSQLANSYNAILEKGGFNKISGSAEGAGLGSWLRDIEQYTPAEYYKDKKIYEDEDKLGEYINRFIVRPFSNLFRSGKPVMDDEFSITDAEASGGDDM